MTKHRWWSVIILLVALGLAYFLFIEQKPNSRFPFKYGLDLVGGTELIYTADTTGISDVTGSMETLKEVVERRVNIFGVSEPLIQIESAGLISGNKTERLIVELPGITDIEQAKAQIGKTKNSDIRIPFAKA
jgi:preprotein translocase subunit SecD